MPAPCTTARRSTPSSWHRPRRATARWSVGPARPAGGSRAAHRRSGRGGARGPPGHGDEVGRPRRTRTAPVTRLLSRLRTARERREPGSAGGDRLRGCEVERSTPSRPVEPHRSAIVLGRAQPPQCQQQPHQPEADGEQQESRCSAIPTRRAGHEEHDGGDGHDGRDPRVLVHAVRGLTAPHEVRAARAHGRRVEGCGVMTHRHARSAAPRTTSAECTRALVTQTVVFGA